MVYVPGGCPRVRGRLAARVLPERSGASLRALLRGTCRRADPATPAHPGHGAQRGILARLVWSDHRKVVSLVTDSPFKPVPRRRAFEDVIVQVEEAIADGRIGPGDRLPPERELAGQLRVSRASVREALRVLEAFGVADLAPGPRRRRGLGRDRRRPERASPGCCASTRC